MSKSQLLVVDDNQVQSYALRKILENAGFAVLTAETGNTALQLANEHKPPVILLDINLPDVNGFEVCARIKGSPDTQSISVIFYTAVDASAAAKDYAQQLGASAFLTYPVASVHLLTVVRGALARFDAASHP
jgi:CheY-like chemotaxis protein